MRGVRWALPLVAVLALLAAWPAQAHHKPGHGGGTTTTTTVAPTTTTVAPTTTTTVGGNRSGLPWKSGARSGSFPAGTQAFENWRGRLVDISMHYTERTSWATVENPWPLGYNWPGEFILVHPMWPTGSGVTFAQVAAGTHDAHYRALGTNIVNSGRGSMLVSLGWEMNGVGWPWDATANPTGYVNAYRRIVDQVHVTAPNVRFAWVFNGDTPDPTSMYPGDAWVNVIGVDDYDMWPTVDTQGEWDAEVASVAGLQWAADFATARGKKLLVQEWGLAWENLGGGNWAPGANHGGDNPFWMQHMQDWFRSHASVLYGEIYFDAEGGTRSQIFDVGGTTINPNASTEYKAGLHG